MRNLNYNEKSILRSIVDAKLEDDVSLKALLEKIFFTEKKGRALIIQTIDRYVVLYLKSEMYDDEKIRKREVVLFLELISLLKYLNDEHYISFMSHDFKTRKSMYFVQDNFGNPEPSKKRIVLNAKGDYTLDPHTIVDKNDKVLYRGILFDLAMYDFLVRNLPGITIISKALKDYVKSGFKTKEYKEQRSQKLWSRILGIVATLVFAVGFYLLFNTMQKHESYFNTLSESDKKIISKISDTAAVVTGKTETVSTSEKKTITYDTTTKYYGIDISKYNKNIVEEITILDSLSFIVCKATEGLYYRDSYFDSNWEAIKEKGLIRGGIPFFHRK